VLVLAGAKGKRYALPHSRILLHQPHGGAEGQAVDIEIQAKEITRYRRLLEELIALHTGQPSDMGMPDQLRDYSFRAADARDASSLSALVDAAYGRYVARIGILPRPMTDDYEEVIRDRRVIVAERGGAVAGVIVLAVDDEGFLIDNVAVHPADRGRGLGRTLLELAEAEARRAGFDSIYLYTHEKMNENLALYARIGYVEYDRRSQGDFSLVYMRKHIG